MPPHSENLWQCASIVSWGAGVGAFFFWWCMKVIRKKGFVIEMTVGEAARIMAEVMRVSIFLKDGPLGNNSLSDCEDLCEKILKSGGQDVA